MKRIIIVDDTEFSREILKHFLLKIEDLQIVGEASTGFEAITLCKLIKPNIIAIDLIMPGETDFITLRKIRENHPDIIIIAISGVDENSLEYKKAMIFADAFIKKPFDEKQIFNIFRNINKRN